MKQITFLSIILLFQMTLSVHAQKLTVDGMGAVPMDLSASQYERKAPDGKSCALIKVQLAAEGAQFDGNVVGQVEYKTSEYWVYMSQDSHQLHIKHPKFEPLDIDFQEYGISEIQGKVTYVLILLMPEAKADLDNGERFLTLIVTPPDSKVTVDGKPLAVNADGTANILLQKGTHDYQVEAKDYVTEKKQVILGNRSVTERVQLKRATINPEDLVKTYTVKGVKFNMIHVTGGRFVMGKNNNQEINTHLAKISDFSIGETEVTQELWEAVMGSNPCYIKGKDLPIMDVSWNDCQEFIKKLNSLTGLNFRLPTEAEWEYAAIGGKASKKYTYSGSNKLDDVAWRDVFSSHPVKSKKPNELGIYDMSGGASEWCQDAKNGNDKDVNAERAIRGVSEDPRPVCRSYMGPLYSGGGVGMRLAL